LERGGGEGLRIDLHATLTERFDAFDEGCEAIIALLTNEQTTFTGSYVQLTDAYCNPKPIQRPHPPICIGGQGERRTLRSVARFAQHWNFPGGSAEQFAAKLDVLRGHCADIGRDPAEITVSAHLIGARFGTGVDAVVEEAKRYADAGLDLGLVYLPTPYRTDLLDELARRAVGPLKHLRGPPRYSVSPRSCAPRRWGISGSEWDRASAPTSCRTAR